MQLAEEGVLVPGNPPVLCPSLARVTCHGCTTTVAGRNVEWKANPWFGIAVEAEGDSSAVLGIYLHYKSLL